MEDGTLLEKRKSPRFYANYPVTIKAQGDSHHDPVSISGRTLNISEGGLGLIIPDKLPASPTYTLSLNLAPHYNNIEVKIAFRWQQHQLNDGYNECGVLIVDQSEESKETIHQLIYSVLAKNN